MRTVLAGFIAVGLVGCGYSDRAFVNDVVELDCRYALDCYDDAALNSLGWDKPAACKADRGPELAAWGEGCEFDKQAAKECSQQLRNLECTDGELEWPAICDSAYTHCGELDDTVDTGDTGPS